MTEQEILAARAAQACREALMNYREEDLQHDLGDSVRYWWMKVFRNHKDELATTIELFLQRAFSQPNGCLTLSRPRYQTTFHGKREYVYRLVAHGIVGVVPTKRDIVRHLCNNPSCIHPDHLRIGSHQQNMRDLHWVRAGRYGGVDDEDFDESVTQPAAITLRPQPLPVRSKIPRPKAKPWKSNKS